MPTSTTRNKKQQTVAEPLENQMWEREGFDRRGIRREFAGVQNIGLGDKYVEQDDRTIVDPRTIDMPVGPTGMGETGGSGVEMVRVDGERWPTHRWVQGFTTLAEDNDNVAEQRNAVLELFDFFADASFLTGLGPNGEYADGMFDWLRNAIPAERTFDAEDYDGDSGDEDYSGVEENLIKYDAYSEVSGKILDNDNANWDVMVGSQSALANFNKISGSEGGISGESYWSRLNDPNAIGGVEEMNLIPDDIAPTRLPSDLENELDVDQMIVDLVDDSTAVKSGGADSNGVIGNDEVFLLPNLEDVRENYWRVHEMGTPQTFGPLDQRGGKTAYDYATRYTHRFNPKAAHAAATDAVHIKNPSVLFK